MGRKLCIALLAALTALVLTASAQSSGAKTKRALTAAGATLTVDNDRKDCPSAGYTRIRSAIDAAHPGDTIVICAGTYVEGSGQPGTICSIGADPSTLPARTACRTARSRSSNPRSE